MESMDDELELQETMAEIMEEIAEFESRGTACGDEEIRFSAKLTGEIKIATATRNLLRKGALVVVSKNSDGEEVMGRADLGAKSMSKQFLRSAWRDDPKIPAGRTLNTITPSEWRAATQTERQAFMGSWARRGHFSFVCLNCGYPTEHGRATCEACNGEKI